MKKTMLVAADRRRADVLHKQSSIQHHTGTRTRDAVESIVCQRCCRHHQARVLVFAEPTTPADRPDRLRAHRRKGCTTLVGAAVPAHPNPDGKKGEPS